VRHHANAYPATTEDDTKPAPHPWLAAIEESRAAAAGPTLDLADVIAEFEREDEADKAARAARAKPRRRRRGVRLSIRAKAQRAAFRRHDQQKGRPDAAYNVTKALKEAAFRIEMGWSVPAPTSYAELRRAGEAWVHAGR
jgi:hypothetical protein